MAKTQKSLEVTIPSYPHPRLRGELYGHEEAERILLSAYRSQRLHHAWLIAGIEGIGKASLAYRMARFVLSYPDALSKTVQDAQNLFVPREHNVFHLLSQGVHPDCHNLELDEDRLRSKKTISVEAVRALSQKMLATAGNGGWRIAVIDSIDDLNKSAANALLKLLEEPPQKCLFLLVTHRPGQLMATLSSRCQKLKLNPLNEADLAKAMRSVETSLPSQKINESIAHAHGSVRIALNYATDRRFSESEALDALLENLPHIDVKTLQQLADAILRKGEEVFLEAIAFILQWCHKKILHVPEHALSCALSEFAAEFAKEGYKVNLFNLDRKAFLTTHLIALGRLVCTKAAA
jgi:DNA polymerase-3 subunit delta'